MSWWAIWAWGNVAAGVLFGFAAWNGHKIAVIPALLLCTIGGYIAGGEWMAKIWKIPRL